MVLIYYSGTTHGLSRTPRAIPASRQIVRSLTRYRDILRMQEVSYTGICKVIGDLSFRFAVERVGVT